MQTTHSISRRKLLAMAPAAVLAAPAFGQGNFPARPIRIVIPYGPGGGTDTVFRIFQRTFEKAIGGTAMPDFAPGAGTQIGTLRALAAPQDGYTMLLTTSAVALNTLILSDPRYKMADFEFIAPVVQYPYMLLVNKQVPATTLMEFIALAKRQPGKLNIISLGKGSPTSLLAQRMMRELDIQLQEITYPGSGPAQLDFLAGRVEAQFVSASKQFINPAQSTPLAVAGEERLSLLPDTPTFKELGFSKMVGGTWFGLFASKGVPPAVLERLRQAASTAIREAMPAFVETGHFPVRTTVQEFPRYVADDLALWDADIKAAGAAKR